MASDFTRAFGLAHKLFSASDVAGITPADWNMVAENSTLLRQIGDVFRGRAEITLAPHVIDCDATPFVPHGWMLEDHQKGGKFKWDPTKVELYRTLSQKKDKHTWGNLLHKELKDMPVLNANVLDYLFANQELIPEEWKENTNGNTIYIFFWGTIYRNSDDGLHVRCLSWRGARWGLSSRWLGGAFFDNYLAALRAS